MVHVIAHTRPRSTGEAEPSRQQTSLLEDDGATYEEARNRIRARLPEGWIVTIWQVGSR